MYFKRLLNSVRDSFRLTFEAQATLYHSTQASPQMQKTGIKDRKNSDAVRLSCVAEQCRARHTWNTIVRGTFVYKECTNEVV